MELEVRGLDAPTKRELSKKVTQYKCSLQCLKEDCKKVKGQEERNGLFGGRGGEVSPYAHKQTGCNHVSESNFYRDLPHSMVSAEWKARRTG